MLSAFLSGLGLGGGLIIAIGAQNAFVLRQGLRREHVLAVAAICFLCDLALIVVGAAGVGRFLASSHALSTAAAWGGAAFLAWFGFRSFRAALHPGGLEADEAGSAISLRTAVATALALSLLNPHVYLDTVVVLGAAASQVATANRPGFVLGAALASFAWFFGLGFGARALAPVFKRPTAWRVLDAGVGAVMWTIALALAIGAS